MGGGRRAHGVPSLRDRQSPVPIHTIEGPVDDAVHRILHRARALQPSPRLLSECDGVVVGINPTKLKNKRPSRDLNPSRSLDSLGTPIRQLKLKKAVFSR